MQSIEFDRVTLEYGRGNPALEDIAFRIDGPKIVGLIGRNGAGKTSLLSLLAAFLRPTAGQVLMDGAPIYERPAATEQIAFLWDRDPGDAAPRVGEQLEISAWFRPDWNQPLAERLIDDYGIPLKKKISKLSHGQKAALNVTIGLAARAPLTIFDEAYLGLDAPGRRRFYQELLADYMECPRTILFSTHYIGEVEHLFEEVILLEKGRLIIQEETETLKARGCRITGSAPLVRQFVEDRRVLVTETLGGAMAAVVFGDVTGAERARAEQAGLLIEQPSLQELLIALTGDGENGKNKAISVMWEIKQEKAENEKQ